MLHECNSFFHVIASTYPVLYRSRWTRMVRSPPAKPRRELKQREGRTKKRLGRKRKKISLSSTWTVGNIPYLLFRLDKILTFLCSPNSKGIYFQLCNIFCWIIKDRAFFVELPTEFATPFQEFCQKRALEIPLYTRKGVFSRTVAHGRYVQNFDILATMRVAGLEIMAPG